MKVCYTHYFDNIDWSNSLANKSCSEQWDTLKNVIETGTNRFVPKLKENKKRKTSWMTKKVKKLLNKKYRLFKLVKNNGSVENLKNLKCCFEYLLLERTMTF